MKEKYKPIVGITIGDPAGIGPEIILKALERNIFMMNAGPLSLAA